MKESRSKWIVVHLLYSLIVLYMIYLTGMVTCFLLCNYTTLINWFQNRYPDAYRINEYHSRYFTLEHYNTVQYVSPVLLLFLGAVLTLLVFRRKTVNRILYSFLEDCSLLFFHIIHACTNLSLKQKIILSTCFLLILSTRVYLFITLPYQVDEAFNFVYFIHNGFLHTSLFSNNHVLYNLISTAWWKMDASPMLSSRLTSILISLLLHLILCAFVKRIFDFRTAVIALLFCALSFWVGIYSVEGYAYMLVALCWLIGTLSIIAFVHTGKGYYLFLVSAILGLYSSKLFVIPLFATILFWVAYSIQRKELKHTLRHVSYAGLTIFIGSILQYLPQYLWSGAPAVSQMNTPGHDFISQLPALVEILSVMTGVNAKSYWAVGGLIIFMMFLYKRSSEPVKALFILNMASIFSILLFIGIFHVYPPSRAFVYTNILFLSTVAVVISVYFPLKSNFRQYELITVAILLIKGISSLYLYQYGWQKRIQGGLQDTGFYNRIDAITEKIMQQEPALLYIDQRDSYLECYVRLKAIHQNRHVTFTYALAYRLKSDILILQQTPLATDMVFTRIINDDQFGKILVRK
jgi:hypothetical protein